MKTKTSNKFNIVLIVITLLLIFVAGVKAFGKTNSWLSDKDDVGFIINVENINITVQQDERLIVNGGNIYLGTEIIEVGKEYDLNVTITNNEDTAGYYIRCQAFALVDGVTYNINSCITNDFYNDGEWMYNYTTDTNSNIIYQPLGVGETKYVIDTVTFSAEMLQEFQGKYFRLYLFIEGSPSVNFDV